MASPSRSQYQFQNVQPTPSGYQPQSQNQLQVVQSQHSQVPFQQADPYQSQRKICNPCCCWCCTCCNLRVNCYVIAALLILVGVWDLTLGIFVERVKSCENLKPDDDYLDYCNEDLHSQGYLDPEKLDAFNNTRAGLMWSEILFSIFSLAAAGFLLATICARKGFLPLVAAVLILLQLIPFYCFVFFQYNMYAGFPHIASYKVYSKSSSPSRGDEDVEKLRKPSMIIGAFVATAQNVYFAMCCFQFMKQINANVDREPHSPPCCGNNRNAMDAYPQPPPVGMAPPPAYSSTATYHTPSQMNASNPPPAPPGYAA